MACGRTILMIAVCVGAMSIILQILGYTCPGWVIVSIDLDIVGSVSGTVVLGYGDVVSYLAVWYTKVCVVGEGEESCTHQSFHDSDETGFRLSNTLTDVREIDWAEVQILLTLALVFGLFGLALATVGLFTNAKLMASVAAPTMLISWVLILPAVIIVGLAIQDTESAVQTYESSTGTDYIDICPPWALILSAVGLILALVCCLLLLVSACKLNEKTSGLITPESTRNTPISSPSEDDLFTNPLGVSKILMREGTEPHLLPQYNQDLLPPIGSEDTASLNKTNFGLNEDTVSLQRSDFGLNAYPGYPEEPPIDYDPVTLLRSTPPMDTSLNPTQDFSRQNTKTSFKGEVETPDGRKISIDTTNSHKIRERDVGSANALEKQGNKSSENGEQKGQVKIETIPTAQVKNVNQTAYQKRAQGKEPNKHKPGVGTTENKINNSKTNSSVIQPLPTKGATKTSSTVKTSSPRKNKTDTGLELV